jgi:hypothetical protein
VEEQSAEKPRSTRRGSFTEEAASSSVAEEIHLKRKRVLSQTSRACTYLFLFHKFLSIRSQSAFDCQSREDQSLPARQSPTDDNTIHAISPQEELGRPEGSQGEAAIIAHAATRDEQRSENSKTASE